MRVKHAIGPCHECISNIGEIAVLLYGFLGLIFLIGRQEPGDTTFHLRTVG